MAADVDTEFATMVREHTATAFGFWWHGGLHYHADDAPRRVTRRCPVCNPASWTCKLCINGREYRRRQKSQRRKNRARGR